MVKKKYFVLNKIILNKEKKYLAWFACAKKKLHGLNHFL